MFYHTKKCEGTTTQRLIDDCQALFYHTKKCEGTTTYRPGGEIPAAFYHTKKCEGTRTEENDHGEDIHFPAAILLHLSLFDNPPFVILRELIICLP